MREETKQAIAPLLRALREYPVLEEVRDSEFHLNGRDFIHFHETPSGVIADVLLSSGRVSMPVSSTPEQADLLDRIESRLASLQEHERRQRDRKRGGRRREP